MTKASDSIKIQLITGDPDSIMLLYVQTQVIDLGEDNKYM